ncbi:MAG: hypothetical protein OEO83_03815 [Alphaproteobacteria bacterium]|nr:hypothetical protein [Alphaproteobacteria bacterium]
MATAAKARVRLSLPRRVSRRGAVRMSRAVLDSPKRRIARREDIFRIKALGMDWDIGVMVYEPANGRVTRGADGKKAGFFLLHGGNGDFKSVEPLALLLAERFGYRAVSMTFPGRLYFPHRSRDWPGDTISADGTARMPIWKRGEVITPDQYRLVHETSLRDRYGTRTLARAKRGTLFYHRMAAWPAAFEAAMLAACRRHFPEGEYSVYAHGHSTGGAFTAILSQRLSNMAGQTEVETAPIGEINRLKHAWSGSLGKIKGFDKGGGGKDGLDDPFSDLYLRTWRDRARYAGPEALGKEGPQALMRLPALMEDVLDLWQTERLRPQFKAEFLITHNVVSSLADAARVSARRLKLSKGETTALVERYLDYGRYLRGPEARPVPPLLFVNSCYSRDNSEEVFNEVVLPQLAGLDPAPKTRMVIVDASSHLYTEADGADLPLGMAPVAAQLFDAAVRGGFFAV